MRNVTAKVPYWMHAALQAEADDRGMALSQMVADMLLRRLREIDPDVESKHRVAPF